MPSPIASSSEPRMFRNESAGTRSIRPDETAAGARTSSTRTGAPDSMRCTSSSGVISLASWPIVMRVSPADARRSRLVAAGGTGQDAPMPEPSTVPAKRSTVADILPGLALSVLVALLARAVHNAFPPGVAAAVGEVILAVLLGLLIGNTVGLPTYFAPGIRFSFQTVLRLAIVLLGAAFSVQQVAAIGGKAVLMIVVLMAVALLAAHALGRLAGVPPRLATLIGVGTAVCGNSAIVATAPVIGAHDDEVSFAVATNTLFGTLAVFLYPILGHAMHLNDPAFGSWAGSAVNDTSQVVAAGFAYSEGAGRIATAVKLTRNALMGVVIVLMGVLYRRARAKEQGDAPAGTSGAPRSTLRLRVQQSVPLFVLGFLAMAVLQSAGVIRELSTRVGRDLTLDAQFWARVLILVALAGVGLSTKIAAMRRAGLKPFYVGFAVAAAVSAVSLLWIHTIGPAAG